MDGLNDRLISSECFVKSTDFFTTTCHVFRTSVLHPDLRLHFGPVRMKNPDFVLVNALLFFPNLFSAIHLNLSEYRNTGMEIVSRFRICRQTFVTQDDHSLFASL